MSCGCSGKSTTDTKHDPVSGKYGGILIPPTGKSRQVTLTLDDIPTLLGAKSTDHISKDTNGLALILFVDDLALMKDLPVNAVASTFANDTVRGPALLIEDNGKSLDLDKMEEYGF